MPLIKEAPGQPFDGNKHPRGAHGRFGSGGSAPNAAPTAWGTAGKVVAGAAGIAAVSTAAYYGARYLAAHPDTLSHLKNGVADAVSSTARGIQRYGEAVQSSASDAYHTARAKAAQSASTVRSTASDFVKPFVLDGGSLTSAPSRQETPSYNSRQPGGAAYETARAQARNEVLSVGRKVGGVAAGIARGAAGGPFGMAVGALSSLTPDIISRLARR